MSREWKPGDVGVNVHHGYRGIFVPECANTSHSNGPHWHNESGLADGPHDIRRPLVVIDPEDREQVERLARMLWYASPGADWGQPHGEPYPQFNADMQAALREFADPKPPRPEEPTGLGAVVRDADRRRWVRTNGVWDRQETEPIAPLSCRWDDVQAVEVLDEGWSA
jgi:hypothetical protein